MLGDASLVQPLNKTYRGKDQSTNVLSFASDIEEELGDLIFDLAIIQYEAKAQDKTFENHFKHLILHGSLHLLGYDHETEEEAAEMEALEIAILAEHGLPNPYEMINIRKTMTQIQTDEGDPFKFAYPLAASCWQCFSRLWAALWRQQEGAILRICLEDLIEASTDDEDINENEGLDAQQRLLIGNILRLRERLAEDIAIPRADIPCCPLDAPLKDVLDIAMDHGHSRLPVYDGIFWIRSWALSMCVI